MNIRQQLNNNFFALFIAALLIGVKDASNLEKITIPSIVFFFYFFFLRLKIYLDDNHNLSDKGDSSEKSDFVLGYVSSIISWIIFPIAAYRVWDESIWTCILFVFIGVCVCSIWTISAAFFGEDKERKIKNKHWFHKNAIYILLLLILLIQNWGLKALSVENIDKVSYWITLLISIILIIILCHDYRKSETFKNARK